jgi:hypothetical protein
MHSIRPRRASRPIPRRNRPPPRTLPSRRRTRGRRNSKSRRGHPRNRGSYHTCAEECRRDHCPSGHREGKPVLRDRSRSRRWQADLVTERRDRSEPPRPRRKAGHRARRSPAGPGPEDTPDHRRSCCSGGSYCPIDTASYPDSQRTRTVRSCTSNQAGTRRAHWCPRCHSAAAECMHSQRRSPCPPSGNRPPVPPCPRWCPTRFQGNTDRP